MSDDEARLRSGEEDEAADVEASAPAETSRYNLRPRVTTKELGHSHQASPLCQTVDHGGLETSSAELVASLKRTLAMARGEPPVSRTTVTDAQDREER